MFDRFRERARKVMGLSRQEACRLGHDFIGTGHILLGIMREGTGVAAQVLARAGARLPVLRAEVERVVGRGKEQVIQGQLPFTPGTKRALELTLEAARELGHHSLGTEHLLLGLLRVEDGVAIRVLRDLGLSPEAIEAEVLERIVPPGEEGSCSGPPEDRSSTPATDFFGRDLTDLARSGRLGPALDRSREVEALVALLASPEPGSSFRRTRPSGPRR